MTESESIDDWTEDERNAWADRLQRRETLRDLHKGLELRLGIPVGFIDGVTKTEDDWGFMIKVAVLCEAAVTRALVDHVSNGRDPSAWYAHFSRLANDRRLSLATDLGILSAAERDALQAIAQIRNSFAHDVRNLGGSLSEFFAALPAERKAELATRLLFVHHRKDNPWDFYIKNMRLLIALGMLMPVRALAQLGLNNDERSRLQKDWELADLWRKPLKVEWTGRADK